MLFHPVAEHLPQDIAPELRQRGVNEQVLLLQCFCQRAARTGLLPLPPRAAGPAAAYREYQAALWGFNQRLAVLRQCLGMQSALSSYAARHTWATMAYHCEIHPGIISEAMGHSSITVTETYLKPFSNRKIDEANQRVISFVRSGACTV